MSAVPSWSFAASHLTTWRAPVASPGYWRATYFSVSAMRSSVFGWPLCIASTVCELPQSWIVNAHPLHRSLRLLADLLVRVDAEELLVEVRGARIGGAFAL